MPPSRLSPAQEAIARINERVGRIGVAPKAMPVGPRFQDRGYDAARGMFEGGSEGRAPTSRADAIRKGDATFAPESGRGRLERTLRQTVADIEEGRDNGEIKPTEADAMLARAAKITEGLYSGEKAPDWLADEAVVAKIIRGEDDESALDRVVNTGGNALLSGLKQISRPGSAVLNAYAAVNRESEKRPVKVGPVEFGGLSRLLVGDPGAIFAAGKAAKEGFAHPERAATPGSILNDQSDIRESRGRGRGFFGTDVGDVSTSPLINNPAMDMLVYALTDPATYVSFGTTSAGKGALRAAEKAVPGVRATLRQGGLAALTPAERAALEAAMTPRTMRLLETAQGGVRLRAPAGKWSEGKTLIPGEVVRKPLRAVKESGPAQVVAKSVPGEAVKGAARAVESTFVPRAAVRRRLGEGVANMLDDARVGLSDAAGQQTQRQLDLAMHAARQVTDLTMDDLAEVGRALDLGGGLDDLPARLRPLGEAIDQWRKPLSEVQVQEGVLLGPEARQEGLDRAVDARAARLLDLFTKDADLAAKIADKTDAVKAVTPDLDPAVTRAADAGYVGGRSDAVIADLGKVQARAAGAGERVGTLKGRSEAAVEARTPAVTPVDAPIKAADRKMAREVVNDLAARAHEAKRQIDMDIVGQVELPRIPTKKVARGAGGEWDWAINPKTGESLLDAETRAAYQRIAGDRAGITKEAASRARLIPAVGGERLGDPTMWMDELGVGTLQEAVDIVLDRVRAAASLDQLSRGMRPWWPEALPMHLDEIDHAVIDALPTESVQGYASGIAERGRRGPFTPGRKNYPPGMLDKVVRAWREGDVIAYERGLAAEGLDLPANVESYTDTSARDALDDARMGGRMDEAGLAAARAGREVPVADARAARASRKAEVAADRVVEAMDSVDRQATRAAEQSLNRGKKVAEATRTLQIKRAKLRQEIKAAERELAAAEEAALRGTVADEDYLPRILTPDAVKVMKAVENGDLQAARVAGIRNSVTGDGFVTARKAEWADMSIADINAEQQALMDAAVEAGIIKNADAEWFDSNPLTAFAQRDLAARRHIIAKQFYGNLMGVTDDTGERVALHLDELDPELSDRLAAALNQHNAKAGAKEMATRQFFGNDEWVFMDVPALGVGIPPETIVVRREIADELGRVTEAFRKPEGAAKVLDEWMKLWKGYATVPLPFGLGFHLRNAQGNVFLNWLAGMTDMAAYGRAMRLQLAVTKGVRKLGDPFAFLNEADAAVVRDALDRGVIGDGFFAVEVGREARRGVSDSRGRSVAGMGKSKWQAINPFSTDNVLIDTGRRFGAGVENNARLAHYLWALDTLGDGAEAARSVRRTLFDYGDLTAFERNKMKRVWAFYTFMRKSTPVVAEAFAKNPHKLSRIQQLRMTLAEDSADPEGLYPSYLGGIAGVPLPQGVSTALSKVPGLGVDPDAPLVLGMDLPGMQAADKLADAAALAGALPGVPNVTDRTGLEGFGGLASLVSGGAPGAVSAGLQATLGRRFFGDASLMDKDIEASLPARLIPFLAWQRDIDGDGDTEASMTQKADFLFESLFPMASKIPWGTKAEADKAPRRTLSMLTGLNLFPLGEQTQEGEAYQRLDDLKRYIESIYARAKLTEGDDVRAGDDRDRATIEEEVRAEFGIKPNRALTPEAREEVKARMEAR